MSAHGEVIHKIYNPTENSREHRKTSKIIWYHPENNWGPIIDNLVQFEEDFNSRTKKLRSGGGDRLSQTRPLPRSPNGDDNMINHFKTFKHITPPSTQISGSKFQKLSRIPLKNCGVWKNHCVWLKYHDFLWCMAQTPLKSWCCSQISFCGELGFGIWLSNTKEKFQFCKRMFALKITKSRKIA